MRTVSSLILGAGLASLVGCTSSTTTEPEYTREEARALMGKDDHGADLCDLLGFYGDGICDDFCPEPDSDCAQCLAYPSCYPGETAYEREGDCPADSVCREVSLCGATIWCADQVTCAGYPSCAAGETEYESEEDCQAGSACREVSLCGATIWCGPAATCLAVPSCDPGETAHTRWQDCPQDASCREVTVCGSTVWCSSTNPPACAGRNPAGCVSTGCPEGQICDPSQGTAPSACTCEPETGTWLCTADVSGGICVDSAE